MSDIIQLKITLWGTKPPIWRRILVDKTSTFEQLHHTIQIAMGWTNSHLHEFQTSAYRIGELFEDFDADSGDERLDEATVTLDSILSDPKQKISYTYYFGDSWEHRIVVEKMLPREAQLKYPVCIGGQLNCPPEDCGGIPGFYSVLDVIGNPKHPERQEMLEWLGEEYDAEQFDKDEINQALAAIDSYLKK
jgi:hypothetical protein